MDIGDIGLLEFEHLPKEIFENIAETPQASNIIDAICRLPLKYSAPAMMQIILKATPQEVAEYHKITARAVYKKNKCFLKILNTSLKTGSQ